MPLKLRRSSLGHMSLLPFTYEMLLNAYIVLRVARVHCFQLRYVFDRNKCQA